MKRRQKETEEQAIERRKRMYGYDGKCYCDAIWDEELKCFTQDGVCGGIVRHFKGNLYEIKDIVKHSESGELLVIYQALYSVQVNPLIPESVAFGERQTFARPMTMFAEEVDRQKYPHAGQKYRMEIVRFKNVRKGEKV